MSLQANEIASILQECCGLAIDDALAARLVLYLDLLLRWNARTNLTAVREPEAIVVRHFGESLACARALPGGLATLLDYGSGAGFPGALCALARPEITVTLAESQGKKAAFLQELSRTLGGAFKVHAERVEALPGPVRFNAVTLRAVDKMAEAVASARTRVVAGGWLVLMTTKTSLRELAPQLEGLAWRSPVPLAGTQHEVVAMARVLQTS